MTRYEGRMAITRKREETTGNVLPFVSRTRREARASNEASAVNLVAPTNVTPAGDDDDPGPSAA